MNIKFSPPDITQEEIDEVVDTLKSGWITTGPKTKKFEKLIAEYCHTQKAVCLNSATAGLELILRFLGIGEGDEVITSAYTYTASASVINHVGAKIVLVDTDKDSFYISADNVRKAVTDKTKAIIGVDIAGVIADYDSLFEIANQNKGIFKPSNDIQKAIGRIAIIADGAHSFGAIQRGKTSGEIADFTSFSFHAVKNLTTAEGGAVTWRDIQGVDNEYIYTQLVLDSLHGQSKDALSKMKAGAWEYDIKMLGYKCNMTDIMASLGLVQLKRYEGLLARRKEIISKYDSAFKGTAIKSIAHYTQDGSSSGHLYITRVKGIDENKRNEIIIKMAQAGIATNVHYKPLPLFSGYKELGFDIKDYPHAYDLYRNEITLPLHTLLTDEEVQYIIDQFKEAVGV
ncbi:MAG: DegT/DnrJ/EryC1/StrS family aminotransferase [Clostridia bacterium]|nr:DegT/DnrJ/EryC1/StrS family aminotransferase [Clostridia bacterium]